MFLNAGGMMVDVSHDHFIAALNPLAMAASLTGAVKFVAATASSRSERW